MRVDTDMAAPGGQPTDAQAVPQSVQAFCARTTAYLPDGQTDAEFVHAMRDITHWHQQRSPWSRALLAQRTVFRRCSKAGVASTL